MDLRKLKTILELFEKSNLQEIEFSEGEERIRLQKPVMPAPPPRTQEKHLPTEGEGPKEENPPEEIAGTSVKSPMVGTFYRSPSPDKSPFVQIGQRVTKDETLCIIEAMKLMNEIPSPVSGVVKEIRAINGEPVAYGSVLFVIE